MPDLAFSHLKIPIENYFNCTIDISRLPDKRAKNIDKRATDKKAKKADKRAKNQSYILIVFFK